MRYRKNVKTVFGVPDLAFMSKKVAVFIDSEFWHGKYLADGRYTPKTNSDYWISKLQKNIERDGLVTATLIKDGWEVLRF